MELRHLRYFVAVAEELNFRRAAERLFMQQPPLSRQIRQLEAEVGVPLFERGPRGTELTAAGRAFLEETRHTLAQADRAVHAARQAGWGQGLSVSVCSSLGKYSHAFDSAFAQAVRTLRERHPGLRLALTETSSSNQEGALRDGQADAAFLHVPVVDAALTGHCLLREPLVLALPREHPAAALPEVPLGSLGPENLFLFPERVFPPLYRDILAACERAGFRPKSVQGKDSPQRAVWLVGAGLGVAFVGASFAQAQPPGVVFRPAQDVSLFLEYSVAWRRDNASAVLAEFLELTRGML